MVYLHNRSNPKNRANLYLAAAKASGYTEMFIAQVQDETYWKRIYSEQGPCCVNHLANHYDGNGNMVQDGKMVNVWNSLWFFCFPKSDTSTNCCTILEKN